MTSRKIVDTGSAVTFWCEVGRKCRRQQVSSDRLDIFWDLIHQDIHSFTSYGMLASTFLADLTSALAEKHRLRLFPKTTHEVYVA